MTAAVRPWCAGLLAAAACTACGPAPRDAADAAVDGAAAFFTNEDAAAFDPDASLGLSCTDAMPSFATAVAPILEGSCAGGELCHGFPPPPALYVQLVGGPDECDAGVLVAPASLEKSYLLHKLTGIGLCPNTQRMPPGGSLPASDIQTIADWICAGAPND